jgi:hypothetical protein
MDINGVWASVCFPSFLPGFVGQRLTMWPDDPELAFAAMRAYNDWHLEAWCGPYPDRFVPQQIAWLRDPVVAGDEIRKNAERGFKAVTFSEAPFKLGLPTIHSGYWASCSRRPPSRTPSTGCTRTSPRSTRRSRSACPRAASAGSPASWTGSTTSTPGPCPSRSP